MQAYNVSVWTYIHTHSIWSIWYLCPKNWSKLRRFASSNLSASLPSRASRSDITSCSKCWALSWQDHAVDATLDHPHASTVPEDLFRSEIHLKKMMDGEWIFKNVCAGRFVCSCYVWDSKTILEPNNVIYWLQCLPTMGQYTKGMNMENAHAPDK